MFKMTRRLLTLVGAAYGLYHLYEVSQRRYPIGDTTPVDIPVERVEVVVQQSPNNVRRA